ncbi:MAG TPA: PIN domain-containing protein [Thermoanaerobaculia bacterium]|jgi:PIN domain nuclease of toxin-antitoxin system|nr:PIN domain-containing protein [Thermoanaerobaculia bacterium]
MPKVLLDTWTFQQYLEDESQLSEDAQSIIRAAVAANDHLYVSAISYLEARLTARASGLSRHDLDSLDESLERSRIQILPVTQWVVVSIDMIPDSATLADRIAAAQALSGNYTLLTGVEDIICTELDCVRSNPAHMGTTEVIGSA